MTNLKQKYNHVFMKFATVFFGFLLLFILVSITEYVLWKIVPPAKNKIQYPKGYYKKTPNGLAILEGDHQTQSIDNNGKVIYDVVYSIDKHTRRITPIKNSKKIKKFILFMGASFVYGEGIHNNETLPAQIAELASKYRPYNYGSHGYGPFDILDKIENVDFSKEVLEHEGIMIYYSTSYHLQRTVGAMSNISWMKRFAYYKENKNGVLERKGSFKTGRPFITKIYKFLSKSSILKTLKIDFPLNISEKHIKLMAKTILTMKLRFQEKYPDNPFYVVLYPSKEKNFEKLKKYLDDMDINYLDYLTLFNPNDKEYRLSEYDPHPTPLANRIIAQKIVEDLKLE